MASINFEAERKLEERSYRSLEGKMASLEIKPDQEHGDHQIIFYCRRKEIDEKTKEEQDILSPEYIIYGVEKNDIENLYNFLQLNKQFSFGKGRKFHKEGKDIDLLGPVKIIKEINRNMRYNLITQVEEPQGSGSWFKEYEINNISFENIEKIKQSIKNYSLSIK